MSNARILASTINSSSQIVVPSGGIAFTDLDSSNDSTTANEAYVMGQDGYEEGTWIPAYSFSGGGTVTITSNDGTYVKVGSLVHCSFRIRSTGVSGVSGSLIISGFPFASVTNSRSAGSKWFARSWGADMPNFSFGVQAGTTQASVYKQTMNSSTDPVGTSDFAATTGDKNVLEASITYRVA